jgi:hypothetical protein
MLLFKAELDLSQYVAVAEYVAVSGGAGPVTVCCCMLLSCSCFRRSWTCHSVVMLLSRMFLLQVNLDSGHAPGSCCY